MPNATTPVLVQGDREIYPEDIDHIRIVLQRFPGLPRKEVVLTLCETLNWLTPAGRPKLDACFKLLHRLEQEALIRLPAKREQYSHRGARRQPQLTLPTERPTPVAMSLADLGPVELIPLIDQKQRALCNGYIQRYHPLGFYEWPDVKHYARGMHPFKSGRPGFPPFVHGRSVLPSHTQPVGKGWKTRTPFPGLSIHLIASS